MELDPPRELEPPLPEPLDEKSSKPASVAQPTAMMESWVSARTTSVRRRPEWLGNSNSLLMIGDSSLLAELSGPQLGVETKTFQ